MISDKTLALVLAELDYENEDDFIEHFSMFVFDIMASKGVVRFASEIPILKASIAVDTGDLVKKEDEVLH